MAEVLDFVEVYEKGLSELSHLKNSERLVFMLLDFDILMEMEGWDHFFIYEHHFVWYAEMKDWLHAIGDEASLAVLDDYEASMKAHGVTFSSDEIYNFLNGQNDAYRCGCPDWCGQYLDLKEQRWEKAKAYLEGQGLKLLNA